jgi:hypothetical protein
MRTAVAGASVFQTRAGPAEEPVQIARRVNLSAKAVSTTRCRHGERLGITNEVALVHLTMQQGVSAPPVSRPDRMSTPSG